MTAAGAASGSARARARRGLVGEIRFLVAAIPSAAVLIVLAASLAVVSGVMRSDLRKRALATADEIAQLLEEPLYKIDDDQSRRIGEAMLSSGRISGIELESTASGLLLSVPPPTASSLIAPEERSIARGAMALGRVRLHFSDRDVQRTQLLLGFLTLAQLAAIVAASLGVSRLLLKSRVEVPLEGILEGIEAIGRGDYQSRVGYTRYQDVNSLVSLVNDMADKVATKNRELQQANVELESRVAERTAELRDSLAELSRTQEKLVYSEKLTALGRLSASFAHELNTPLGAISSSLGTIAEVFDAQAPRILDIFMSVDPEGRALARELLVSCLGRGGLPESPAAERRARAELKALAREKGIDVPDSALETLAELGVADRAGEVDALLRHPRGADIIEAVAGMMLVRRMADVAREAEAKASGVVEALRSYLTPPSKSGFAPIDVAGQVGEVLERLAPPPGQGGLEVAAALKPALALGSPRMLDRVWTNLIRNALQAMEYRGSLSVSVDSADGLVRVEVVDSGPGVPEEIAGRIFEPFFSTKRDGQGMGLGLGICRNVLESHGGSLSFESRPGRTVFRAALPAYGSAHPSDDAESARSG